MAANRRNYKKTIEFKALDKTAKPLRLMARRIERMAGPVDRFNRKFRHGVAAVQPLTRRIDRLGDKFGDMGTSISAGFTLPAAAMTAATIATASGFEFAMNKVRVLTKAGNRDFMRLRDTAKDIGATTQFSASDAARGMNELSVAGFKTREILSSIRPTMNLSAASDMELGETADITSNIMTAFGKDASVTERITDKLTYAFTNSATRLYDLGEAYRMAGGVAKVAGVDFNSVTAMLMKLGDLGHRGTVAGTAISGGVARVLGFRSEMKKNSDVGKILIKHGIKASDFIDKNENVRWFNLLEKLDEKKVSKDDFLTLFGQDYGKYLIAFRGMSKDIRKLAQTIDTDSYGLGKKVASAYMSGAQGAMNTFKASAEALMLSFADSGLLKDFADITNYAAAQMQAASEADPRILRAVTLAGGAIGVTGGGLLGLQGISFLSSLGISAFGGAISSRQILQMLVKGGLKRAGPVGVALTIADIVKEWVELNKQEISDDFHRLDIWLEQKSQARNQAVEKRMKGLGFAKDFGDDGSNIFSALHSVVRSIRETDFNFKSRMTPGIGLVGAPNIFPDFKQDSSAIDFRKLVPDLTKKWNQGEWNQRTHFYSPVNPSGADLIPSSELVRKKGYLMPFQDRYFLKTSREGLESPVSPYRPVTPKKTEEKQEVTFDFRFDNMPEDLKVDIKTPSQKLRTNKQVRHRYGGVYG